MNPAMLPPDDPRAPKYWLYEESGVLKPVIHAYLNRKQLDSVQIGIMRQYLRQWFDSPVWADGADARGESMLELVREQVRAIRTNQDIRNAINAALNLGIDPL